MKSRASGFAVLVSVLWLSVPGFAADREDRIDKLQRQIDELQQEIRELKKERASEAPPAPPPAAAAESAAPSTPATSSAASLSEVGKNLMDRVQIGGYGSVRFEANSATGDKTTFELRRFVLTTDAAIAPRLRGYFELEFERFRELELERKVISENGGLTIKQAVDGTDASEIELEQAWLEFELDELAKIRAGAILVPLGRFNLNHDDNRWDLPRRPLIDRGAPVMPVKAAWDELGVGFNGELPVGDEGKLGYQFYVMNGAILQPEVENEFENPNEDGTRELAAEAEFKLQNGTFGKDVKDAKAFTGRVAYSPRLGQEIGASFYRGRYTPDSLPSESITAFGVDGLSIWGPLEFEGEYLHADYGNVARVARGFAAKLTSDEVAIESSELESVMEFKLATLADTKQGFWLEGRYRFHPDWLKDSIIGRGFEDPVLTAVIRGEEMWIDNRLDALEFSAGQVTGVERADRRLDRLTIGGSYRPVPLVVFQLAYEYTHVDKGALSEVTNYLDTGEDKSHAVMVGAAFGF